MPTYEETIVTGIGIEAIGEAVFYVPSFRAISAGIGVAALVVYEFIENPITNELWAEAMDKNNNVPAAAKVYLEKKSSYTELKKVSAEKTILQMEALSLQDRANEIKNLAEYGNEAQIWCADLTEDLSGDVGIIEVPGEQTARNIQPGYNANAVYSGSRDGQIL
ncbi:hypothetical protein LCGC14_1570450, partial [marine sediment metagenome]